MVAPCCFQGGPEGVDSFPSNSAVTLINGVNRRGRVLSSQDGQVPVAAFDRDFPTAWVWAAGRHSGRCMHARGRCLKLLTDLTPDMPVQQTIVDVVQQERSSPPNGGGQV